MHRTPIITALSVIVIALGITVTVCAQKKSQPHPPRVEPSASASVAAPSDAVILLSKTVAPQFQHNDGKPVQWPVKDGVMTIKKGTGDIISKQAFGDCQLHVEFNVPKAGGGGQGAGNSGVKLQKRYEVQILESLHAKTTPNKQCGALYNQYAPLVNACREPGQWQTYDIIYEAPTFDDKGNVTKKAYMTVFHNGVLIHDRAELKGTTNPNKYQKHAPREPLLLQDHGHAVQFRNIWIRATNP